VGLLRFFKHGEVLAIVLPDSLRVKTGVKEGDEFEWLELDNGLFALATKDFLSSEVKKIVSRELPARLSTTSQSATASTQGGFWKKKLSEKGFLVITNDNEAKDASSELSQEIKKGLVVGARGFDKKYYICTRAFFENAALRVKKALGDGEKTAGEIGASAKMPFDAALVAITLLKDEGELIEKKRGSYALVR
jgi:hypothetical protein